MSKFLGPNNHFHCAQNHCLEQHFPASASQSCSLQKKKGNFYFFFFLLNLCSVPVHSFLAATQICPIFSYLSSFPLFSFHFLYNFSFFHFLYCYFPFLPFLYFKLPIPSSASLHPYRSWSFFPDFYSLSLAASLVSNFSFHCRLWIEAFQHTFHTFSFCYIHA